MMWCITSAFKKYNFKPKKLNIKKAYIKELDVQRRKNETDELELQKKKKNEEQKRRMSQRKKIKERLDVIAGVNQTRQRATSVGTSIRHLGLSEEDSEEIEGEDTGNLKEVFENIVIEELRRKQEDDVLSVPEIDSSVKFRKKRMDLLMKYYEARNVRAKNILGDKEITEITTKNLIVELEDRVREQRIVVNQLRQQGERTFKQDEFDRLLKLFAGDSAYMKIKFLHQNKHSQTTPIMIDQKQQVGVTQILVSKETQVLTIPKKQKETQVNFTTEKKQKKRKRKGLTVSTNRSSRDVKGLGVGKKRHGSGIKTPKGTKTPKTPVNGSSSLTKEFSFSIPKKKVALKRRRLVSEFCQTEEGKIVEKKEWGGHLVNFGQQHRPVTENRMVESNSIDVDVSEGKLKHEKRIVSTDHIAIQCEILRDDMEDESTSVPDFSGYFSRPGSRGSGRASSRGSDRSSRISSKAYSDIDEFPLFESRGFQCGTPRLKDERISVDLYNTREEEGEDRKLKIVRKEVERKKKKVIKGSKKTKKGDTIKKKPRQKKSPRKKKKKKKKTEDEMEGEDEDEEEEEGNKMGGVKGSKERPKRKKSRRRKKRKGMVRSRSIDVSIGTSDSPKYYRDREVQVSTAPLIKEKEVVVEKKYDSEVRSVNTQVSPPEKLVETQKTQTREAVKKDWWISESETIGTQAKPTTFDYDVQVGPDGVKETGIQNAPKYSDRSQQFPRHRRRLKNHKVQTKSSYVQKIVRTFDKYIQAEFGKVRFRVLERIPSQEIRIVKIMVEKKVQVKPKSNSTKIQTFIRTYNQPIQTSPVMFHQSCQAKLQGDKTNRYIQVSQRLKVQKRMQTTPPETHKSVQTRQSRLSKFSGDGLTPSSAKLTPRSPRIMDYGAKRRVSDTSSYQNMIRKLQNNVQTKDNQLDTLKSKHQKHLIDLKKKFQDEAFRYQGTIKSLRKTTKETSMLVDAYRRELDERSRSEKERLINTTLHEHSEMKKAVNAHNRRLESDYDLLKRNFNLKMNQHKDELRIELQKREKDFEKYKKTILSKYEETVHKYDRERAENLNNQKTQRNIMKEYDQIKELLTVQKEKFEKKKHDYELQIKYLRIRIKEKKEQELERTLLRRVDEVMESEVSEMKGHFDVKLKTKQMEHKVALSELSGKVKVRCKVRDDMIQKLRFELNQREQEIGNIIEAQKNEGEQLRNDLKFLNNLLQQRDQEIERLRTYIVSYEPAVARPSTGHSRSRPTTGHSTTSTGTLGKRVKSDFQGGMIRKGSRPATSHGRPIRRIGSYHKTSRPKTASGTRPALPSIQINRPKTSGFDSMMFFDEASSGKRRALLMEKRKNREEKSDLGTMFDTFKKSAPSKKLFSGAFYSIQKDVKKKNNRIIGKMRKTTPRTRKRVSRTRTSSSKKKVKKKKDLFCLSGITLDLT